MKAILLAVAIGVSSSLMATDIQKSEKEVVVSEKPTETYRSDQYSPGVISEYMKVTLSDDRQNIVKIEYWYIYRDKMDTHKSEKYTLKLKNQEGYDEEEVGNKGMLQLPNSEDWKKFIIAEGMFDLIHEEDRVQTFNME